MKLTQARIIGVESWQDKVVIKMQLAGSEDTSKPIEMTVLPAKSSDTGNHEIICRFKGLNNRQMLATRRELCADGEASLHIGEV
jgi:hypothetical protein